MSESKRSRKNRIYRLSFPFPKHYKPTSIAAPLSNLQGESQQSCCVRLNPLLCFLITRHACVRTHYFPHASPPFLVPVHRVTLKMFALLNVSPHLRRTATNREVPMLLKKKKEMLLCMIIRAQTAISNQGWLTRMLPPFCPHVAFTDQKMCLRQKQRGVMD